MNKLANLEDVLAKTATFSRHTIVDYRDANVSYHKVDKNTSNCEQIGLQSGIGYLILYFSQTPSIFALHSM